jgi:hypothetical protein
MGIARHIGPDTFFDSLAHVGIHVAPVLEDSRKYRPSHAVGHVVNDVAHQAVPLIIVHYVTNQGAGRWATIVPQTWIRTLRPPAGACVLRLENPSVTAVVALVTNEGRPASVLTRALIQTAQSAGIDDALGGQSRPAGT